VSRAGRDRAEATCLGAVGFRSTTLPQGIHGITNEVTGILCPTKSQKQIVPAADSDRLVGVQDGFFDDSAETSDNCT
jgi:hypothetical protein